MALWGNKDSKSATGTIAIATNGVVTGSSTLFTTEAKIGNYIRAGGVDYQIVTITSNTVAKVESGINGGAIAEVTAGATYTLSEKPAYVAASESAGSPSGVHGNSNRVFGVNVTEAGAGGDNVVEVALVQGGSGYVEVPGVSFSGGGGSGAAATATISGGAVTGFTVTNSGSSYETLPTVTIPKARVTIPTSGITAATDLVSYTGHGLTAGDAVVYVNGGGSSATGLTTATTYYVATAQRTANAFTVKAANTTGTLVATVAVSGTAGEFTCGNSTLAVNDRITITGTLGGTATITGYATGTTYKVSDVTGTSPNVSGFTLTTVAGAALTTTAGTLTGLTYVTETVIDISGTGNNAQYFEKVASTAATATAAKGSGATDGANSLMSRVTHAGWIRRTVGTGGRAGRIQYETLVANGTTAAASGDQADDIQFGDS